MYEVTIIKSFSAAHLLAEIGGKCEELHGHNFKVEVTVAAKKLNSHGLLIDFRFLKKVLGEILDDIDLLGERQLHGVHVLRPVVRI